MFSFIKKMFAGNTEPAYGQNQSVTIMTGDEKIEFAVGKRFPLEAQGAAEGETLIFADILLVNLLWRDITPSEMKFLKGLCDGMSIYQNEHTNIIVITFVFAGKPIFLPIVQPKETIKRWRAREFDDGSSAFFFLTESRNQIIKSIRNITLSQEFIRILKHVLKGYEQPNLQKVQELVNLSDVSFLCSRAQYRWRYSQENEEFVFVR